jgi:hypothetical protein
MSADDARFWERNIQPDIVRIADDEITQGKPLTRSDFNWPWVSIRIGLPIAQRLAGRRCRALTVFLPDTLGNAVPAAMLFMIEEYPWLLQRARRFRSAFNFTKQSTFTWFLSSAPKSALRRLGVAKTPSLLRILIDAALATSVELELKGRMWLHAAPEGGDLLFDLYSKLCKLLHVRPGKRIPKLPRAFVGVPSDGRHFYATPSLAKQLINELQENREI